MSKLQDILSQKQQEVSDLYSLVRSQPEHEIMQLLSGKLPKKAVKDFKSMLTQSSPAVIAEIKRRSPSRGALADIDNPVALARIYAEHGASALSILTDEKFFGGSIDDLKQVAEELKYLPQPILRKDFIIDKVQIAEAILAGADAVLLIVAVLKENTAEMLRLVESFGIQALVEVHNLPELQIALEAEASVIGINNRDLQTFKIYPERAFELLSAVPADVVKVAESGILTPESAKAYFAAGFDAVLIGEALVTSTDPGTFIKRCRNG